MKKIVVLGSNSFSGSHFVDILLNEGNYSVLGISRSKERDTLFLPYKEKNPQRFKFYQMNLNKDLEGILNLIKNERVEYVVNYSAQGMVGESWKNPEQWFNTNCLSVVKLCNSLKELPFLKRYLHISTNEVYGTCNNLDETAALNPSTPYASSKAAADMFIKNLIDQFDFRANIIRSTNVYGPGQQLFRIIPRAIIYNKMNKKISLHGGGNSKKSYLHIWDNCLGTLKVLENGALGEIYHLSPETGISIREVVKKICDKSGKEFEASISETEERPGQDSEYSLNSTKIREQLGWEPKIGFDEGLESVIKWVNENWTLIQHQPLEYSHEE